MLFYMQDKPYLITMEQFSKWSESEAILLYYAVALHNVM